MEDSDEYCADDSVMWWQQKGAEECVYCGKQKFHELQMCCGEVHFQLTEQAKKLETDNGHIQPVKAPF